MVILSNLFDSFNQKSEIEFDLIENTKKLFVVLLKKESEAADSLSWYIKPIYAIKDSQIIELPVFISEKEALEFKEKAGMKAGVVTEVEIVIMENSLYVMKNFLSDQVLQLLSKGWNVHTVLYSMSVKNDVKKIATINKYWADDIIFAYTT